jgi:hypothetical protein
VLLTDIPGGVDTATAEAIVGQICGITLPRLESGSFYGIVDYCGGHTNYHFHQRLACLFDLSSGHSTRVGQTIAGLHGGLQYLYGKYENYSIGLLPTLDACGGHHGVTPDSSGASLYHYHVQDQVPFTFGCYGPNLDGR